MTSEKFLQRSDLLGTQIITRNTGKRLGVVSQIWVDVDRREVVALGIRENIFSGVLSGTQQTMLLSDIRQIGDVILVEDDAVLEENISLDAYSSLINSEVITETGELLGKVRGFKFNINDGRVASLIIASIGIPLIPDQIVSTYELSIDEVVSSGPDRLIVFEGAEEKLSQITVGLLERLGIGVPPWEREDEEDYYVMPTSTANQLGTGSRPAAPPMRTQAPAARESWNEDDWSDPVRQRRVEPAYQEATYYEEDLEEDNWGDSVGEDYKPAAYLDSSYREPQPVQEYDSVMDDAWADDDNPEPYRPQKINFPEKTRAIEYEEEADY